MNFPTPDSGPFEQSLADLISARRTTSIPSHLNPIVQRLLDPTVPPPPWPAVVDALMQLNISQEESDRLRPLYLEAGRRRRRSLESPVASRGPVQVPPAVQDADGYDHKPDPLDKQAWPRTFAELDELLRRYWRWAGRPASRKIALRSGDAFSHTTVNNRLIGECRTVNGTPFTVRQDYLAAFIRACGGTEEDVRNWVTAWRRIERGPGDGHGRYE